MGLKDCADGSGGGQALGIEQRHRNISWSDSTSCDLRALVEDPT